MCKEEVELLILKEINRMIIMMNYSMSMMKDLLKNLWEKERENLEITKGT